MKVMRPVPSVRPWSVCPYLDGSQRISQIVITVITVITVMSGGGTMNWFILHFNRRKLLLWRCNRSGRCNHNSRRSRWSWSHNDVASPKNNSNPAVFIGIFFREHRSQTNKKYIASCCCPFIGTRVGRHWHLRRNNELFLLHLSHIAVVAL